MKNNISRLVTDMIQGDINHFHTSITDTYSENDLGMYLSSVMFHYQSMARELSTLAGEYFKDNKDTARELGEMSTAHGIMAHMYSSTIERMTE